MATAPEGALEEDAPAEGGSLAAAAEGAFAAADAEAAEAANKLIAAAVGVDEWVIDPRGAAQVENVRYAVGLARDLSLEAPHAAFLAVLADDLLQHAKAGSGEEAAAAMFKRRVAENAAARPARPDTLPAAAVKPVADFFVRGFFAHYKLHAFLFGHERALDQQKVRRLAAARRWCCRSVRMPYQSQEVQPKILKMYLALPNCTSRDLSTAKATHTTRPGLRPHSASCAAVSCIVCVKSKN